MMTSRERVLSAVEHREPDRVPIDLGGTPTSGIMAQAMADLRRHLGNPGQPPRIFEIIQMLAEVEDDLIDRLRVDVLPVMPPAVAAGLRHDRVKPWTFRDGTVFLVPETFAVEEAEDGALLMREGCDPTRPVYAKMPATGQYFDVPALYECDPNYEPPPLREVRARATLPTETLEFCQARAENLRAHTDKALMAGGFGHLGLMRVGSLPDFLVLMATDPDYVHALFDLRVETTLRSLEKLEAALGGSIDILAWDSFDYGSQRAELFSPDWFAEFFAPRWTALNRWVHENTAWKTWQHSCGSIARVLPHLVETGVDCLNPVQCSAAGMDPQTLKERFGSRITFWGGGVDTQRTLPFGTPDEVAAEVRERIRIFAPGGGFVFNPTHNIQAGTPPENVLAAFDAAREAGAYGPLAQAT